jgi:hypothetical protein
MKMSAATLGRFGYREKLGDLETQPAPGQSSNAI